PSFRNASSKLHRKRNDEGIYRDIVSVSSGNTAQGRRGCHCSGPVSAVRRIDPEVSWNALCSCLKRSSCRLYRSLPFVLLWETAKNREEVERFRVLLEPTTAMARQYARKAGLSIDWKNPNSTASPLLWVTQTPRDFDFDRGPDLPQFYYSGPWHDGYDRIPAEFPWERLTGEPIVYVSMGTLQNGVTETFRAIAASARRLKHLQFVLAIGNQITPEQIGETASNVLTVAYAPQIELLKR